MNKIFAVFALTTAAVAQVSTIPAGTSITVRTNEAIYARQSDGRVFTGTVEQDVPDVNGYVAIPRGAQVELIARNVNIAVHIRQDRKSTRLNSSHQIISYAVFCLKKKRREQHPPH